ncbi:MAG: hypothetical protein AAF638_13785 [Pseudomonadota bacterium]
MDGAHGSNVQIDSAKFARDKHLRKLIMQNLLTAKGYCANEDVLLSICDANGYVQTKENLRGELKLLDDLALVSTDVHQGCMVVRLTDRGQDLMEDRFQLEEVARVRPDELSSWMDRQ